MQIIRSAESLPTNKRRESSGQYTEWKRIVRARGNGRCRKCGRTKWLQCHHILPWRQFPEKRFDPENGELLCVICHAAIEPWLRDTAAWRKACVEVEREYRKWEKHSALGRTLVMIRRVRRKDRWGEIAQGTARNMKRRAVAAEWHKSNKRHPDSGR